MHTYVEMVKLTNISTLEDNSTEKVDNKSILFPEPTMFDVIAIVKVLNDLAGVPLRFGTSEFYTRRHA